jgi:hypothetical protein
MGPGIRRILKVPDKHAFLKKAISGSGTRLRKIIANLRGVLRWLEATEFCPRGVGLWLVA